MSIPGRFSPGGSQRLSHFSISRKYRSNLNRVQVEMNRANERAATGIRYKTMDEDVASGLRAFTIRRNLQRTEAHLDNTQEALSVYESAESFVTNMVKLGSEVASLYNPTLNGTHGEDEYAAIGAQIGRLQEELLSNLNGQFSDRYLFGASNTTSPPFTVDPDDKSLVFNFKDEDGKMQKVKVKELDENHPFYETIINDASFVDIGLGLQVKAGEIIPSSVFDRSFNGMNIIGMGPGNMYDKMTEIVKALDDKSPDPQLLTDMNAAHKRAATSLAKMGADVNYLEFAQDRLISERLNLQTRQKSIEGIDLDEAALQFQMLKFTYDASLAMGSHLLQPSLFSYLK